MIVDCGQVKPLHMPRNNNKRAGEHAEAALCALCFVFRFFGLSTNDNRPFS